MIQRIQSIWLLLASVCGFLTLNLPFYSGSTVENAHVELNGQFNILLLILTVITSALAAICIFLFKNRKLQLRLAFAGLFIQFGVIAIYIKSISEFTAGTFALWSVLTFLVPIFYIMALVAINNDQKLIKSMDRLR